MKTFIFLLALTVHIYAQNIHTILVPGTTSPTIQKALDEFWWYSQNRNYLTADESFIEEIFSDIHCNCAIDINWPLPMLAFIGYTAHHPYHGWQTIKWTGLQVETYAKMYRYETDANKKLVYEERAKKGAEFLLWAQSYFALTGAYLSKLCCDTNAPNLLDMGTAGIGLFECYRTFGDIKYFNAGKLIADFIYNHPPYPHQWYSDPYLYYGNPNHLAEGLRLLSHIYQLVGDQKYLDLALQISEELFAWQDYKHNLDPWQEPGSINGNWDGSWYWYMYDPDPLPLGCVPNGNPLYNGKAADKRMGYHCITLDGLTKFAQTIEQQQLPGTTTIRNNLPSQQFRNNIINSIIRATNYVIDNQETENLVTGYGTKYRGLIKGFKLYRTYGTDFGPDPEPNPEYGSTMGGLGSLVNSLLYLQKTGVLTSQDIARLNSVINSVSTKLISVRNWGINDNYAVVMHQWEQYIEFLNKRVTGSNYSLVNNSFEDKDIIWELWSWDGSGVEISDVSPHTGTYSIFISDNSTNHSKWASILVSASQYNTYEVKAWARVMSGSSSLYLKFLDENFNELNSSYRILSANSVYTQYRILSMAPSSTKYAQIILYAPWFGTSETFWDDIQFIMYASKDISIDQGNNNNFQYEIANYPNPFNPKTQIFYTVKEASYVEINLYNFLGKKIRTLVASNQEAGSHQYILDANNLPSGIYFCTLITKDFQKTHKIILTK